MRAENARQAFHFFGEMIVNLQTQGTRSSQTLYKLVDTIVQHSQAAANFCEIEIDLNRRVQEQIKHTPKKDRAALEPGEAFDIDHWQREKTSHLEKVLHYQRQRHEIVASITSSKVPLESVWQFI